ncbi:hypothetical protein BMS3Abin15_00969 [bacterium BMS3Abin15]|nr:hypothetical protein BMS3Abin15_00969 [bacterium BMS3Abin15]HDZ84957.1 hypothetical protein [Candidatus Moranbacteria bacterium]
MLIKALTILAMSVILIIFSCPILIAGEEEIFAMTEWKKVIDLAEKENTRLRKEVEDVTDLLEGKIICGTNVVVPSAKVKDELTVILSEAKKLIAQSKQMTNNVSVENETDLMDLSDRMSKKLLIANNGHVMIAEDIKKFKSLPLCDKAETIKKLRI